MSRNERRLAKKSAAQSRGEALMPEAVRLHQAGRLAQAESLYQRILADAPGSADALHLLGLIAHQTGRTEEAVSFIRRAIALNGQTALYPHNLGKVLIAAGRYAEAESALAAALTLAPAFPGAQADLAYALFRLGRFDESEAAFLRALSLQPDNPEALNNYGLLVKRQGRDDESLALFQRALAARPAYPDALNNIGLAYRRQGKIEEAIGWYRKALAINPRYVMALTNMGNALREMGAVEESEAPLRQAVEIDPQMAEAHSNLGNTLKQLGRMAEAQACYERAMALKPDFADAPYNMACFYHEQGLFAEASRFYDRALALDPAYPDAHWNRALLKLLHGDFVEGWREYEWRWRKLGIQPEGLDIPFWDGGDLRDKTILLRAEQGLGDSLQFVRYAPLVKAKGGRVILSCPGALIELFRGVEGLDAVVQDTARPEPAHDCQALLMSLPHLLGTTLETVPAQIPYLAAPPEKKTAWAARFAGEPKALRVGLLWAGNPRKDVPDAHAVDRRRSMKLDQFAPLAKVQGVRFYSLQKDGEAAAQAKAPPPGLALTDFMGEVQDFTDTAALIEQLDLVIGVDTSVIHLAGALGKPVWVLSRFDGCWRWLLDRADSPWYPTLRLFRQARPGDWTPEVEAVREALSAFAAEVRSDGPPFSPQSR